MTKVTVGLLGPFEVMLDGRPVSVPRGQQRTLLASLALRAAQVVSQETLARHLWNDVPPRDPRNAVRDHVRRLRTRLGDDAIRAQGTGYLLDVEPDNVDAVRFDRLLAAAAVAPPSQAHQLLSEALGLWRGDPLTEVGSERLECEYGSRLVERRLLALERRADANLAQRHSDRDLAELRDLAERNPLREPVWVRLIAALLARGAVDEATDTYERIRQHLRDTLGSDPGADLQRLHRRILALDPDHPLGPLVGTRGRVPFEVAHRLPPDPLGFAGRDRELATLNELLIGRRAAPAGAQTVCTLHGVGGAGKTALAVHWAHRVADEFPDGQLYLDLHGYGPQAAVEPASALATILQAVGIPPDQMPAELATLTAMLRTHLAGHRLLIVLDNVRDADQVHPLLPSAQSLVLVTSRSPLDSLRVRDGAWQVPVGALDDRDARKLLAHSIAPARLGAEPTAAHRIIELCGGLPLPLRIVSDRAAWQPDVTLERLAADLASASDRPAGPSDGDDPATRLRPVLSWSYDRLETETAAVFRLLGLYPGPEVAPEGMAALAGCPIREAGRQLDRLVSVHLLEPRSHGRYRLHDLVREYAMELVAGDDPDIIAAAVRRILDWCLRSVAQARETIGERAGVDLEPRPGLVARTFSTSAEVVEWFDAEREMLVGAVRTATDRGHYRQGLQLARILRTFFHRRLRYEEFIQVAELGVECARRLGDDEALVRGLRTLGVAYTWAARAEEANASLREAVDNAERLGDLVRLASAADGLGINYARMGDFATALAYHRRAVDASRRLGDQQMIGDTLVNRGFTEIESGDSAAGIATTREALAIFEETGAELPVALAQGNLADAYQRTERPELAAAHARRSLATLRRLGNLDATAEVLVTLGRAQRSLGETREATAAWLEAAELVGSEHWLSPTVAELLDSARSPA